jgi:uncharacterized membrane protein
MEHEFKPVLKHLAMLSAFCLLMEIYRLYTTETLRYIFLPWNLLLAWVPVWFAAMLYTETKRYRQLLFFAGWVLFFPNAPYIITDLLHLKPRDNFPFWFDSLLLYSFAFAGLLPGIISALMVHKKLRLILSGTVADGAMFIIMFMSGYGIYMGRFLRYNSWDIITSPNDILSDTLQRVIHPFHYPGTYGVTLMCGTLLCLVFFLFKSLVKTSEV